MKIFLVGLGTTLFTGKAYAQGAKIVHVNMQES